MSVNELSIRFFLQIAVILGVCRFVAWIARSVGQSVVVSEMIAGVFLGPSLFGLLAPRVQEFVFPKASMPILFSVCQVGLALYMFTVGLEFDVSLIQKRMRSAAAVSIAGMATPFLLGMILAWYLIRNQPGEIFSPRTSLGEALMFMGASMSITAFPMLARIIYERGLSGTSLGTLALAAGSMDDAGAWCVLAVVLASFSGDPRFAALAIGGGVAYAAVTLTLGRRLLAKLGPIVERAGRLNADMLTLVLTIA